MNKFKVTLWYLQNDKRLAEKKYSWNVSSFYLLYGEEENLLNLTDDKPTAIVLKTYDKEHKIQQTHRVPLDDVSTMLIERKGGWEKRVYRLHGKKTQANSLWFNV